MSATSIADEPEVSALASRTGRSATATRTGSGTVRSTRARVGSAVSSHAGREGPYAPHHAGLDRAGERVTRSAKPPERFAAALEKALDDDAPFAKRPVGGEAKGMLLAARLLPAPVMHAVVRAATGLPRARTLQNHSP